MILKDFFDYYFNAVDSEILNVYQQLMPAKQDLAEAYADMFARNDEEAIAFLLKFHRVTSRLVRDNPQQAILFNVHDNVCFPFFLDYIWEVISDTDKAKLFQECKTDDYSKIKSLLQEDKLLRNWFRKEIGSSLSQADLFTLNEIIALQNFSSGGENSFLQYVYPLIQKMEGKVLDAGCGAGFASLVMSQYMSVYSVDACKARLERAKALADMMRRGEREIFPQVMSLIEDELGDIDVICHFPKAEELLSGEAQEVVFTEGSIDSLPYENSFFDAINCLDVLEHTYSPISIIKEFSRVLKPGGLVFITAPTRYGEVEQRIYESIDGTLFPAMLHLHHFDRELLSEMFADNGLHEYNITPFDYRSWDEFMVIAERSSDCELIEELKAHPFEEVALQIFAVYQKD